MDLSGKVAWVVGASSGIGAAVACELQSRGALVAISARRQDQLDDVSAGTMLAVAVDVTDAASLTAAASRIRNELGPIDLAVLSAGYWKQMSGNDWDTEVFNRHVQVNLIGMSNSIAAVLPEMLARHSGVIAGISSVAGYRGLSGSQAYGATKAGQVNLLESLRIQVARAGVRVITICPGFVRTDPDHRQRLPDAVHDRGRLRRPVDLRRSRARTHRDRVPGTDGHPDEGRTPRARGHLVRAMEPHLPHRKDHCETATVRTFAGRETQLNYVVQELVPNERISLRGENKAVMAAALARL